MTQTPHQDWRVLLAISLAINDMRLSEQKTYDLIRVCYPNLVDSNMTTDTVCELYIWCDSFQFRRSCSDTDILKAYKVLAEGHQCMQGSAVQREKDMEDAMTSEISGHDTVGKHYIYE